MCTVTYLPTGQDTFIFTHNRDEQLARPPAHPPTAILVNNIPLIYPVDPVAGGTWMAMAGNGLAACLLNGGFKRHKHQPPYKHSRGLVIPHLMKYPSVTDFVAEYDFSGIEPFTLIVYADGRLHEIIWDEKEVFEKPLSEKEPHIYSSTTLYDEPTRKRRKSWFLEWLKKYPAYHVSDIRCFHNYGGEGDAAIDLVMQREDILRTVSITSIEKSLIESRMIYHDLVSDSLSEAEIKIIRA